MMPPSVVVPWRAEESKSRLAPVLGPGDRRALSLAMLADVIDSAAGAGCAVTIGASSAAAATQASAVAAATRANGVEVRIVGGGLDVAIERALGWHNDDRDVLVLAADLPGLSVDAVHAVMHAKPHAAVIIGRSHDGGTNALLLRNGVRISTGYGTGSAQTHARTSGRRGLTASIVRIAGIAEDLDDPADLRQLVTRIRAASRARGAGPAGADGAASPDYVRWTPGPRTTVALRHIGMLNSADPCC